MSSKRDRQLRRERTRREARNEILVRCDDCGLVQPLRHGNGSTHPFSGRDIAACTGCGGQYGTYV